MAKLNLYIVTDGGDIVADAGGADAAMDRWNDEIGGAENLRSFCITLEIPDLPEVVIALPAMIKA